MSYLDNVDLMLQDIRNSVDGLLISDNEVQPLKYTLKVLKPKNDEEKRYRLKLDCIISVPLSETSKEN